jgi:hypothetical protein
MFAKFRLAILPLALLAATAVPACSSQQRGYTNFAPTPEEMRTALQNLLKDRPELAQIPEFQVSLDVDRAVYRDGIVHIGVWKCDPKLLTFVGLFSAPNITMYEVSGRFDFDARDIWVAIPRTIQLTQNQDVGEYWRPHDVDSR